VPAFELDVVVEVPGWPAAEELVKFFADGIRVQELYTSFNVDLADSFEGWGTTVVDDPSHGKRLGHYARFRAGWVGEDTDAGKAQLTGAIDETLARLGIDGRILSVDANAA
jgi:hypothetical protein